MSALGALRRVMKLKIKKKSTAKPTTTKKAPITPKTPMDQPGSEKIKEATPNPLPQKMRRTLLKLQWISQEARRSKKHRQTHYHKKC